MKKVEAVETEHSLRAIKGSRKPAGAQKLCALMDDPVRTTVTEIDRNIMDSRCVEDAEVCRTRGRKRARRTTVPELDTETEALKGNHSKETAVPNLRYAVRSRSNVKSWDAPQCDEEDGPGGCLLNNRGSARDNH